MGNLLSRRSARAEKDEAVRGWKEASEYYEKSLAAWKRLPVPPLTASRIFDVTPAAAIEQKFALFRREMQRFKAPTANPPDSLSAKQ